MRVNSRPLNRFWLMFTRTWRITPYHRSWSWLSVVPIHLCWQDLRTTSNQTHVIFGSRPLEFAAAFAVARPVSVVPFCPAWIQLSKAEIKAYPK